MSCSSDRAMGVEAGVGAPPSGISASPCAAASAPPPGRHLPRFDVTVMDRYLDPMHAQRGEVYDVLRQNPDLLVPCPEALSKEEHRDLVRKSLRVLLAAGSSPMTNQARSPKQYMYQGEILALVDLSLVVKMGVQYSLWGGSVLNLGTERHHREYLEKIDRFELPGCFAMTELRHGSNVASLGTEAVLDLAEDCWVITTPDDGAIKWWIGNAAEDGVAATVFARLKVPAADGSGGLDDHGVHAFIVPLRERPQGPTLPGVEIRDLGYKVGLQGVDNGAIRFTNVRVPRGNLLDRFGSVDRAGAYTSHVPSAARRFAATLGELTGGRIGLVCGSTQVLKGALTVAVRYAAQRQQFGPTDGAEVSVLDYPTLQAQLIPLLATCYGASFAKTALVARYEEMKRTRDPAVVADVHCLSAGLKAYVTETTNMALGVCRAACGGHGYAAVNRFGQWRSDHDIFRTFEGDNTVLLQQVSGLLLKEYANKFKGSPIFTTWSYLKQLASDALPPNPLVTHETDVAHLRDPAFLRAAMRHRAARLLHTLAARLRKHRGRQGDFFAWRTCLVHVVALANAHVESVVVDAFYDAVDACADRDCRASLKALADIFALSRVHADVAFRNDDYIAPEKAKAIHRLLQKLCAKVRGVALPLVDAFGVPDFVLRAPIGLSTAQHDPYGDYLEAVGFGN